MYNREDLNRKTFKVKLYFQNGKKGQLKMYNKYWMK